MTVTQDQIDRMTELRRAGCSIREISADMTDRGTPLSVTTVSRYLRRAGVVGDETATLEATSARIAKARAQAYDRALALLEDAEAARERLYAPAQQVISTPEGVEIVTLAEPPLADVAKLLATIERLVTQANRLIEQVGDNSTEQTTSFLIELNASIKEVVALADAAEGRTPGDDNDAYNYDSDYSVHTDPDQQA